MGRSVLTLSDATVVAYDHLTPDREFYMERFKEDLESGLIAEDADFEDYMYECWEDDAQYSWDNYVEYVQERLAEIFPSMEEADEWIQSEIHVIAENAHSIVTISEYCGAVAICLAPKYDRSDYWRDPREELSGLGETWRKKISDRLEREFGSMQKVGTLSNGESVFSITA